MVSDWLKQENCVKSQPNNSRKSFMYFITVGLPTDQTCKMKYQVSIVINFHNDQINVKYLSRVMRKPGFCLCENKDADQLCSNDQRLCFHYTDRRIPLLLISRILGI